MQNVLNAEVSHLPLRKTGIFIVMIAAWFVRTRFLIIKSPIGENLEMEMEQNRKDMELAKDIFQHDYGITTEIAPTKLDATGIRMSSSNNSRWNRLRRLDNKGRIRNATERNLVTALSELKRIATLMHLPKSVAQDAAFIYRKAVEQKLIRGRSIEGVVAASLYAACRMHNNPRTLDDIGKHSRTGRKEIGRTYRFLRRQLNLTIGLASPDEYIPRFCDQLGVGLNVQTKAQRILEQVGNEAMVSQSDRNCRRFYLSFGNA